jgi:hypothetical protein
MKRCGEVHEKGGTENKRKKREGEKEKKKKGRCRNWTQRGSNPGRGWAVGEGLNATGGVNNVHIGVAVQRNFEVLSSGGMWYSCSGATSGELKNVWKEVGKYWFCIVIPLAGHKEYGVQGVRLTLMVGGRRVLFTSISASVGKWVLLS